MAKAKKTKKTTKVVSILERIKQPSTKVGILALASLFGLTIPVEVFTYANELIAGVVGFIGVYETFRNEDK